MSSFDSVHAADPEESENGWAIVDPGAGGRGPRDDEGAEQEGAAQYPIATLSASRAEEGARFLALLRSRPVGAEPLLLENRSKLGPGWEVAPMPSGTPKSFHEQAVLLVQTQASHAAHLMVVRADRYSTAAGFSFVQKVKQSLPNCVFCRGTAAVVAELQQAPSAATSGQRQQSVSNSEQRGYEIIQGAIDVDASDIHIEIFKEGRYAPRYELKMRINGTVSMAESSTDAAAVAQMEAVITALFQNPAVAPDAEKSHSTFNPLARCYASLKPPLQGAELRFESNATVSGYKVVMRLLSYEGKSAALQNHKDLGFSDHQTKHLIRACLAPSGLVLVVGATGSGKTTTIAATLEADEHAAEKIRYGMEIPPEIAISNLAQLKVTLKTLSEVAVGVARSDPDVVYAGEINNHETALMAQDYAQTGHLTLATFHANSAATALMRLIGERIQMDPSVLGMEHFLRAVLYQSLVKLLCTGCRLPARTAMDPERIELLESKFGLDVGSMFVRHRNPLGRLGKICPICCGSGEVGRTAIAELIVPDRRFLDLIRERNVNAAMDHYRSQRVSHFDDLDTRGKTYVEHALAKAANGFICTNELFDSVEDLFSYEIRPLALPSSHATVSGAAARPAVAQEGE